MYMTVVQTKEAIKHSSIAHFTVASMCVSIAQPKESLQQVPIALYIDASMYMPIVQPKEALQRVPIAQYIRLYVHVHSATQEGPTTRAYNYIYRRF
jgi:hypothetical protein